MITKYFPQYIVWKTASENKEDTGAAFAEQQTTTADGAAAAAVVPEVFPVPAKAITRLLETHYQDAKKASESGVVFVPTPKYSRDIFPVTVVPLFYTFEEMCRQRLEDGFLQAATEARQEAERRAQTSSAAMGQLNLDVRWNVRTLREKVASALGGVQLVDPMSLFDGIEEEHWCACQLALIAYSIRAPGSHQPVTHFIRRYGSLEKMFPKQSLVLFHVDFELAGNEGAKEKGLHCKHLLRPDEKMYTHRIAAGDCIVAVVLS